MGDIGAGLSAIAFFGFIAFCMWVGVRKKQAEKQMAFEARKQIFDKIGTGAELMTFLASKEGKEFLDREIPDKPRGPATLGNVGGTMIWGLVATGAGVGFIVASHFFTGPEPVIVSGFILVGTGIGLLVASGISYRLFRKWGIIQKETAWRPGSKIS